LDKPIKFDRHVKGRMKWRRISEEEVYRTLKNSDRVEPMNLIPKNGKQIGRRERRLRMVDKCYFCKAKVVQQQVTIDYRWGDDLVVIRDVPAGVCEQCGEKYLESGVYKELERLAKSKSHLSGKIMVDILAFEESITT